MDDLIAFLEARLTEDETQARDLIESEAAAADWHESSSGVLVTGPPTYDDTWNGTHPLGDSRLTRFIARHDPACVLRDTEADRKLLLKYQIGLHLLPGKYKLGYCEALEEIIKIRAERFSDHPQYQHEWKL